MQALTVAAFVNVPVLAAAAAGEQKLRNAQLRLQSAAPLRARHAAAGRRRANRVVIQAAAGSGAAAGYASALIELGKASKTLDAIHKDVEKLSSLLANKELLDFVCNPTVDDLKKKQILNTLAEDAKLNPATANFLSLLVDKRRMGVVLAIFAAFEELYCEATSTEVAVVTSAVKLENAQQALIAKKLQSMTGAKNIKLKNVVDPSLIAGFVIKYGKDGSQEIDMSVKGQLDRIAERL